MWFLFGEVPLPLGAWDGLRYFIVALPEPYINYFANSQYFPLAPFARFIGSLMRL